MESPNFRLPTNDFYNLYPGQPNEDEIVTKFGDVLDKMSTISDSAATIGYSSTIWETAAIIVCVITFTLVVLKWMMKKEDTNIQTKYLPIGTGDRNHVSPISDQHILLDPQVVSFSENRQETVEIFIENNERPKRFLHKDINEYTGNFSSFLGSGAYGKVYKGKFRDGTTIAVKVLKKDEHSEKKIQEQFMAEVGILGRTHHVNLVKLYGFCFDREIRALVYEFMEKESLDKLLFDKSKPVKWEKLVHIAIGIAKGLAYLHEECHPQIIHYDIKPGNILLDSKLNPKVADFGLARLCNTESKAGDSTIVPRRAGTKGYMAPELEWEFHTVTNKCDVYSFGVLLLEIIGRRKNKVSNASNNDRERLLNWAWKLYQNGELSNFFSECDIEEVNRQDAKRMLMVVFLCVHRDPTKRPTMSYVVTMLEGKHEINQPLYPFDDFESSVEPNGFIGKNKEKSNATSTSNVPHPSHSKHLNKSSEIELLTKGLIF